MTTDTETTEERPTHRPGSLAEMVGQRETVQRMTVVLAGARARGIRTPHILLSGPAGYGKTTLARIAAHELGVSLVTASGPALRRSGDIAGMLTAAEPGSVVFIDEVHRLPIAVEETLYEALEDGSLSIMIGAGAAARAVTLRLPPFICVGATTAPGRMSTPLRDRFGVHLTMRPYTEDELTEIVERSWDHADSLGHSPDAARCVAGSSKGVPRIALHLASRVLDVAALRGKPITEQLAASALAAFGVDRRGLDETDWAILDALTTTFSGRAVGLNSLSHAIDVDEKTIQEQHEGPLIRAGLVVRTPQGRIATPAAYELVQRRGA